MKKYLLVFSAIALAFTAAAQNNNQIDSVVSANAFVTLPMQSHNKKIEIFFNGEKPKQSYYNIKVIDVNGGNTYQDLLDQMQEKAKLEGLDGLIILGKYNYVYQNNSTSTAVISGVAQGAASALASNRNNTYPIISTPSFYNGQALSAIGVKYKRNMSYINKIIKRVFVQIKDSANKIDTVNFTLNGELIKDDGSTLRTNLYDNAVSIFQLGDYFASHAMHESSSRYSFDIDFSTTIKVESQYGNIKYTIIYASDSTLSKILIKQPASDERSSNKFYDITYDLTSDKTIYRRYVRQGRKAELAFTDTYQYDSEKKCVGFIRVDEKTKLETLVVKYEYFTTNDLPQIN